MSGKPAFRIQTLAKRWGVPRSRLNAEIARGALKTFRCGRRALRVTTEEADLYERERLPAVLASIARIKEFGCIYFARATESGKIKIGFSIEIRNRFASLSTDCPEPIELLGCVPGTMEDERDLHRRFEHLHHIGEWFRGDPELIEFIRTIVLG